jgi:hypothetical protein
VPKGTQVAVESGTSAVLKVDTMKVSQDNGRNGSVICRFYPVPPDFAVARAGKSVQVTVNAFADYPAKAKLFVEGVADGQHFWKAEDIQLGVTPQTFAFSATIPPKATAVQVRFDTDTPAAYRFIAAGIKAN